jgi:hypothetical protein
LLLLIPGLPRQPADKEDDPDERIGDYKFNKLKHKAFVLTNECLAEYYGVDPLKVTKESNIRLPDDHRLVPEESLMEGKPVYIKLHEYLTNTGCSRSGSRCG